MQMFLIPDLSHSWNQINGYEKNTMKISQFEDIKQENLRPRSTNQVPEQQNAMDDSEMDGPYDTDVPFVEPRSTKLMLRRTVQFRECNSKKTKSYGYQLKPAKYIG
jgi:hypothetical protein